MTFQSQKSHQPAPPQEKKIRPKAVPMAHQRDISKAAEPLGTFLAKEGLRDKWSSLNAFVCKCVGVCGTGACAHGCLCVRRPEVNLVCCASVFTYHIFQNRVFL